MIVQTRRGKLLKSTELLLNITRDVSASGIKYKLMDDGLTTAAKNIYQRFDTGTANKQHSGCGAT